jgi:nitrate reductase NapE component
MIVQDHSHTSPQMANDLWISAGLGVVLALGIIVWNRQPGQDKQGVGEAECRPSADGNDSLGSRGTEKIKIDTEKFIERTKPLQRMLGVPEDQIRASLDLSQQQADAHGGYAAAARADESMSIFKMLDWLIFLILIFVAFHFLNVTSHGDFGRVLCGIFPREFEWLGLKTYLESYDFTAMRAPIPPQNHLSVAEEL